MRLSWNEVRVRAASFADDWADAHYEKGETQSFYNDFFSVFGVQRRSVARYEEHVHKLASQKSGFIDLFWPGVLIVEQKSAGRDLGRAYGQAGAYFDALEERQRPRFILVSDFQTFELHDLGEREKLCFPLADLPQHVEAFGFILGVTKRAFRDQDPANVQASELVGRLHDALEGAGYVGHDLERFLVRIVFCLFADDTGIFEPRDIFLDLVETRTRDDGSDLGPWLSQLFQVLDTPEPKRQRTLDEDLARFPYVNGELFDEPLRIPSFDAWMRARLLELCRFDWSGISPAIFGALFQSVMDPAERRAQGAHYTTEKNILKVIEPLFMDDLRREFGRLVARKDSRRRAELRRFLEKLGSLKFFDPACGCGNFLVITYRELRKLELEVLRALHVGVSQIEIDATILSKVDVDQFYGIEIDEFPVRIAETAMWMMDHIMNNQLSLAFGETFTRIPLAKAPRIVHGDALEIDWEDVLPADQCSYVFGNPPFVGAKLQSAEQRAQVRRIAALGGSGGTLDYVAAWFIRAGAYAAGRNVPIAFVATNSVTQGEQVDQLWPVLLGRHRLEIAFAHRTFAWGSDARGKAHVHVVILGLCGRAYAPKGRRLFDYPDIKGDPEESRHRVLSPYLVDASRLADPQLTVREVAAPINGMGPLVIGSKPIDGGHYIFGSKAERDTFLDAEPGAAPYMRPFVGALEFLRGRRRWILALHDAPPQVLAELPLVRERIAAVRDYRANSKSKPTRKMAETPTLYHVNVMPTRSFLVIPETSSERREYIPVGWLHPPVIPSNLVKVLEDASLSDFALISSSMHMAWMRWVGGRLGSSYRYSIGSVYNTFPMPPPDRDRSGLAPLVDAVLVARGEYKGATLAQLYDPDTMPPKLRAAHRALDRAVDRLYIGGRTGFSSDSERFEHLFMLYERMRAPLDFSAGRRPRRVRTRQSRSRRM